MLINITGNQKYLVEIETFAKELQGQKTTAKRLNYV